MRCEGGMSGHNVGGAMRCMGGMDGHKDKGGMGEGSTGTGKGTSGAWGARMSIRTEEGRQGQ